MEKFSRIKYERPDLAIVKQGMEKNAERMENAASYEEFRKAYLDNQELTRDSETMASVAYVRNTMDTKDEYYEKEREYFDEESAKLTPVEKRLKHAAVHSPFRASFDKEFGEIALKEAEIDERLLDEKNIPLMIEEQKLCAEYQKITAGCHVELDGEDCNFYGLLKAMESTDRAKRKRAFEAFAGLYEGISEKLDGIYDKLVSLRVQQSKNLGFDSYIDYIYPARGRYDYGAKEAAEFREKIAKYVTPAVDRMLKRQAKRLGVDKLRYYDEMMYYPLGNPQPDGTMEEMVGWAKEMYAELSPETKEFFDFMTEYELFDLKTRPGKSMGGYCTSFPAMKAPFIFSNFNGTSADVDVLTHEAGHAFQAYLSFRRQVLDSYVASTAEIDEIHSMTMEHFTYPWMDKFFGKRADEYRQQHLASSLATIPYLVSVDEFQHRVFEKLDMTAKERRAAWKTIEKKYMPWRDYDGNAFMEEGGFWMQKLHIFLYPFYYIDYALAQTCAHQLYLKMRDNRAEAWEDYLNLCKAGGSLGYFDLLKVARLDNPFTSGAVQENVEKLEKILEDGEKKLNL